MTTEADLVAAIVDAPDDPAPFLVYADFLQTKGNPRGELITLMHAGDKKAVAALQKQHKAHFLGTLARHASSIKLEAWRLGFVDHVKLIADTEAHAVQLLDIVADHPSTRFMRTLEVVILGKRRSYAGVDARLVELARPQTLMTIVLGRDGEHLLSGSLAAVFTQIGATPRKSWSEVTAAVAAVRAGPVGFAPGDIAPLAAADGHSLPLATDDLLRGLAAEVGRNQPLGLVARLTDDCAPDVLDTFAASLVTAWTLHGEEPRTAWVYDVAAAIGGAMAAHRIAQRLASISHARAEHAIGVLARMRTPLALLELHAASRHWATRGELADAALEAAARRANTDVLTLLLRAGSDPRDAFDDATHARFVELDLLVLERAMTSGWSAPLATVIDLFHHAPRRAWCSTLVWHDDARAFTLDDPPAAAADVRLFHVAEPLDVARFRDRPQPFEQLARRAPAFASLGALAAKIAPYEIDIAALRARTYRNGNVKNELHEEQRYVKTHRYRGTTYTIAVHPHGPDKVPTHPRDGLPAVVLFELARDLAAANGLDAA